MTEYTDYAARAQRRLDKLPGRKDLSTDDPLVTEIALAQLDATLAVAHELKMLRTLESNFLRSDPIQRVRVMQDHFGESLRREREDKRDHEIASAIRDLQYKASWMRGEMDYLKQRTYADKPPGWLRRQWIKFVAWWTTWPT